MPDLAIVFLLVSCLSLAFQGAAFSRLARRPAGSAPDPVAGGYLRTVACRTLAAAVYVTVAAIQLAGGGTLTAEALAVFTGVQTLWIGNTLADTRVRRAPLSQGGAMPDDRQRLAAIAEVTSELDQSLDRLFAAVAALKELLVPPGPERGSTTGGQP